MRYALSFLLSTFYFLLSAEATLVRSHKERIIHSTVATWHVWDYDSTNIRYPNIGLSQGGTNLFMQEDGVSTLRPTRLKGNGYLWLPGAANNSANASNAVYNLGGDFEVRVDVALDSWTSGTLASKSDNSPQRSWELSAASSKFQMILSTNGTAALANSQSASHGIPAGTRISLRVTVGQMGNNTVTTFYTNSDINSVSWTQLGSPVTNTGWTTNIFASTAKLYFGATAAGNTGKGNYYGFQLRSNINGSIIASFSSTICGQTGYTDTNSVTNAVWTISRGSTPLAMREADSAGVWIPSPLSSNYLAAANNALFNFGGATQGCWFALVKQHGSSGNRRILNKRSPATSTNAGYELRFAGSYQPYMEVADGFHNGIGNSSAPTATDHSLAFVAVGMVNSNMFTYTDGVIGTAGVNRTTITNTDNSGSLYAFMSADTNNSFFGNHELVAMGVCKRTLTTNEMKRLKWELQSRGSRNASQTTSQPFSSFRWPDGTNVTGTYQPISVISNSIVLNTNASWASTNASEVDLSTHQYHHHTVIANFSNITWVAFTSAFTNEDDGGMQVAASWSTNKGQTWSAPLLVVPSQATWTNVYNIVNTRTALPRNFAYYNGTNYLISAIDGRVASGAGYNYRGDALFACEVRTNGTIGTLFRISSATYDAMDGKAAVAYDSTLGPPLMAISKVYGVWGGSYPNVSASEWVGWQRVGSTDYVEPSTFSRDGSTTNLYRLWRSVGNYSSQAYSTDGGTNWTIPYDTGIPNTPSLTIGLRLSTGGFAILGNPISASGSIYRDPLFLAMTASNSVIITNVFAIQQGLTKTPVFHGYGKDGGASYVSACQVGTSLYVAYSLQKERIGFSRFTIPGMVDNND